MNLFLLFFFINIIFTSFFLIFIEAILLIKYIRNKEKYIFLLFLNNTIDSLFDILLIILFPNSFSLFNSSPDFSSNKTLFHFLLLFLN